MVSVYCFTGLPGAGKSAASNIAEEKGFPVVEMGQVVRDTATDELGTEATSSEIGEWATAHREEHGNEIFAKYTADMISAKFDDETVVIDGLRTPMEFEVFDSAFNSARMILVTAPEETRLNRLQSRGREDESNFTLEDLRERDERELEWGVREILEKEVYDIEIENSGTLNEFRQDIIGIIS